MPIRPENRALYPAEWKAIRARILKRARNRCEWCDVANYSPIPGKRGPVVLTIAHLDHDPTHNDFKNLAALCQRCHNRYDAPMRAAGRKLRKPAPRQGNLDL